MSLSLLHGLEWPFSTLRETYTLLGTLSYNIPNPIFGLSDRTVLQSTLWWDIFVIQVLGRARFRIDLLHFVPTFVSFLCFRTRHLIQQDHVQISFEKWYNIRIDNYMYIVYHKYDAFIFVKSHPHSWTGIGKSFVKMTYPILEKSFVLPPLHIFLKSFLLYNFADLQFFLAFNALQYVVKRRHVRRRAFSSVACVCAAFSPLQSLFSRKPKAAW